MRIRLVVPMELKNGFFEKFEELFFKSRHFFYGERDVYRACDLIEKIKSSKKLWYVQRLWDEVGDDMAFARKMSREEAIKFIDSIENEPVYFFADYIGGDELLFFNVMVTEEEED